MTRRRRLSAYAAPGEDDDREDAATHIQATYRGRSLRRQNAQKNVAAQSIQKRVRGNASRKKLLG